ncbi:hypothetical protein ACLMJK_000997 [Lecanora helva]
MPLVLEQAEERDIPRLLDIMYAAFHDDAWNRIMFPTIPPSNGRTASINRYRHEISNNPNVSIVKVVDTDQDGEIIAFARWNIYRTERPESEWKDATSRDWDEGTNVDAANEFFNGIREKRQNLMAGKPHFCLNMLATDPEHQRRGAGRMLLQWGTDLADRPVSLPCYLEASDKGRPLYQSQGFVDTETLDMDMSKWGGKGIDHHYVMIRPARLT